VVARKRSRWSIETIFRDTKQYAGLGACQCWTDAAMVRHVALVLVGFVVLQRLCLDPSEGLGAVKERWQLATTGQGEPQPTPLRACPAHLRMTAKLLSVRGTFLRIADLRSQPANISLAGSRPTPRRRVMPTTGPAHHRRTGPASTITAITIVVPKHAPHLDSRSHIRTVPLRVKPGHLL
jgi:hypothetical protein